MECPDELGILAELHRVAIVEWLLNILWEIVANRKWNPDKSAAKYVFIRFHNYFILGSNHYRTKESIEKEHTPFKFNVSKAESAASISARGYGAKLFPFYVEGTYSTLFRMTESDEFSADLSDWAMKEYIDITELGRIIDTQKEAFEPDEFRSRYYLPMTKKKGKTVEKPFFLEEDFIGSPLDAFIKAHNLKHFYVFVDPNSRVNANLDEALVKLARVYEHSNVELYSSIKLNEPVKIVPTSSFAIDPTDWQGALQFDWRIGEKTSLSKDTAIRTFYKSEFRLTYNDPSSNQVIWGRNDSNGSADDKFDMRFASFTPPADPSWKPQIRVTAALAKPHVKSTDEKLQEHIYLRIEDDLISYPVPAPKITSKLRNLAEPARIRLIVDILEESVKTDPESGLVISNVKSKSNITDGKALHEILLQSLSLMRKHLSRIDTIKNEMALFYTEDLYKQLLGDVHKNKAANVRSTVRRNEGITFETTVNKYLKAELSTIEVDDVAYEIVWDANDAHIKSDHSLSSQGIDILGKMALPDRTVWFALQLKDRESAVPAKELDIFVKTVQEFKELKQAIQPNDKVISVLSLAKKKSFNYDMYAALLGTGNITIVETDGKKEDPVGSVTLNTLLSLFNMTR